MAAINADLFLLDQYFGADFTMRRLTDTCAIYKPVFRSYGYTAEQYLASVDYYLENSKDMEEILGKTEEMLKKRETKILKRIEKASHAADTSGVKKRRHNMEVQTDSLLTKSPRGKITDK